MKKVAERVAEKVAGVGRMKFEKEETYSVGIMGMEGKTEHRLNDGNVLFEIHSRNKERGTWV